MSQEADGVTSSDEIYILREEDGGALWRNLMDAGKEFKIVPSCPNQIDRIEAGMISHPV